MYIIQGHKWADPGEGCQPLQMVIYRNRTSGVGLGQGGVTCNWKKQDGSRKDEIQGIGDGINCSKEKRQDTDWMGVQMSPVDAQGHKRCLFLPLVPE